MFYYVLMVCAITNVNSIDLASCEQFISHRSWKTSAICEEEIGKAREDYFKQRKIISSGRCEEG